MTFREAIEAIACTLYANGPDTAWTSETLDAVAAIVDGVHAGFLVRLDTGDVVRSASWAEAVEAKAMDGGVIRLTNDAVGYDDRQVVAGTRCIVRP